MVLDGGNEISDLSRFHRLELAGLVAESWAVEPLAHQMLQSKESRAFACVGAVVCVYVAGGGGIPPQVKELYT